MENWLLSPEKKKERVKNLLSCLGIFAATATVIIFSALFFSDVSFTAAGTVNITLSFLLLFVSSYIMYVSLFETGKAQAEREEAYAALCARRSALFSRLHEEGDPDRITAFCKALSVKETQEERARLLHRHFTTEAEIAQWRSLPNNRLKRSQRRVLCALAKQKAVSITPRMLLAERPSASHHAPLTLSPERCRRQRTAAFLLPLALFTGLSVSLVCEVMSDPNASDIVGYLLKLFTLLQSGIKGFRAGYQHILTDKSDYMREQCDLLDLYLSKASTQEAEA